jgi:glycosyltransferase involved in cell wall biosynthesis
MSASSSNTITGISVVCPTYNSSAFIMGAIRSIAEQSLPPAELIVADDGSTDDTLEKVERFLVDCRGDFPTRILRNPHRGVAATRNAGILAASGEWIAFLDSDDLWLPAKLLKVSEIIQKYPEVNFIHHYKKRINLEKKISLVDLKYKYWHDIPLIKQLFKRNIFTTSAVTCKKEILIKSGLFNNKYSCCEDYDLWIRLSPHIRLYMLDDVLCHHFTRPGSITATSTTQMLINDIKIKTAHRNMVSRSLYIHGVLLAVALYFFESLRRGKF